LCSTLPSFWAGIELELGHTDRRLAVTAGGRLGARRRRGVVIIVVPPAPADQCGGGDHEQDRDGPQDPHAGGI
jgi:hypothetical protein